MSEPAIDVELDSAASPPRDNGAIVFAAPWERRVFGLALALTRSDAQEWERFRQLLIAQISVDEQRPYWASWAAALEVLLTSTAAVAPDELDARLRAFLARDHGHDH